MLEVYPVNLVAVTLAVSDDRVKRQLTSQISKMETGYEE